MAFDAAAHPASAVGSTARLRQDGTASRSCTAAPRYLRAARKTRGAQHAHHQLCLTPHRRAARSSALEHSRDAGRMSTRSALAALTGRPSNGAAPRARLHCWPLPTPATPTAYAYHAAAISHDFGATCTAPPPDLSQRENPTLRRPSGRSLLKLSPESRTSPRPPGCHARHPLHQKAGAKGARLFMDQARGGRENPNNALGLRPPLDEEERSMRCTCSSCTRTFHGQRADELLLARRCWTCAALHDALGAPPDAADHALLEEYQCPSSTSAPWPQTVQSRDEAAPLEGNGAAVQDHLPLRTTSSLGTRPRRSFRRAPPEGTLAAPARGSRPPDESRRFRSDCVLRPACR